MPLFESMMATVGRMVFPDFVVCGVFQVTDAPALDTTSPVSQLLAKRRNLSRRDKMTHRRVRARGFPRRSSAPLAKSFANITTCMYQKTFHARRAHQASRRQGGDTR